MFRLEKDLDIPLIGDQRFCTTLPTTTLRAHVRFCCVCRLSRQHERSQAVQVRYAGVLHQDRRRNGADVPGQSKRHLWTMQFAERCKLELKKVDDPFPAFGDAAGETLDSYFEVVCREGVEASPRDDVVVHLESRGILKQSIKPIMKPGSIPGDRLHQADEVSGTLSRVGLHPLREGTEHSGRPGPWIGGGIACRLRAWHYRY